MIDLTATLEIIDLRCFDSSFTAASFPSCRFRIDTYLIGFIHVWSCFLYVLPYLLTTNNNTKALIVGSFVFLWCLLLLLLLLLCVIVAPFSNSSTLKTAINWFFLHTRTLTHYCSLQCKVNTRNANFLATFGASSAAIRRFLNVSPHFGFFFVV